MLFLSIVLGLAGVEVTFFIAACMGLCFVFAAKTLWLLLNNACTVPKFSLFLHSDPTVSRRGWPRN